MTVQTAVILAAGMGTRLKELGKSIPKGFLQLGDRPIVEESITCLLDVGIQNIIIITGHLAEFYTNLQRRYPQVTTVHNPDYANSGSMYSLYCAHKCINSDFLLLESDLIYESRALKSVLDFPQENVVLLSGKTNSGDEVYVETSGQTITAMSKNYASLIQIPTGELVGICKISKLLFHQMLDYASKRFQYSLKVDYETDAMVSVAKSYDIYYTLMNDLLWAEIDDHHHLDRAKEQIYPQLIGSK